MTKSLGKSLAIATASLATGVIGSGGGAWWFLDKQNNAIKEEVDKKKFQVMVIQLNSQKLGKQTSSLRLDVNSLLMTLDEYEKQIKNLEQRKAENKREQEKLNEEKKGLDGEVSRLTVAQRQAKEKIESNNKELGENEKKILDQRKDLVAKQETIDELENQKALLEKRKNDLTTQQTTLERGNETLNDELTIISGLITNLEKSVVDLTKEKESLKSKVDSQEEQIKKQLATIKSNGDENVKVAASLKERQLENSRKTAENEALRQSLENKEQELETLKNSFDALKKDLENKKAKLDEQAALKQTKEAKFTELDTQNKAQLQQISTLEGDLKNLKEEFQTTTQQLRDADSKLQQSQKDLKDRESQIYFKNFSIYEKDVEIKEWTAINEHQKSLIVELFKNVADANVLETYLFKKYPAIRELKTSTGKAITIQNTNAASSLKTHMESIKNGGITYSLSDTDSNSFGNEFSLKINKPSWLESSGTSKTEKIKISDVFKNGKKQEAIKVLMAISNLQDITFTKVDNEESKFNISVGNKFSSQPSINTLKNGSNWEISVYSFETKEDFIGYWLLKTMQQDFLKKVDFSDILEPKIIGS